MEPNFMGKEGFTWAVGVVEDRFDPLYLGRCKVRWLGWHTKDKSELPTNVLPWAFPLMPITSASQTGVGFSPTGPVEGTWVMGFFRDGDEANDPVMLGTLPGRPDAKCNPTEGFNDPRDFIPSYWQVDADGNIIEEAVTFTDVPQHPLKVEFDTEGKAPFAAKSDRIKIFERSDKPTESSTGATEVIERPVTTGPAGRGTATKAQIIPDYEYTYNYPLERFLGEPTTPRLARGFGDKSTSLKSIIGTNSKNEFILKEKGDNNSIVQTKADLRMVTARKANPSSMKQPNTFREPESPYNAKYPYNHVHLSESGHTIEIDDTPGHERLHWYHRSGSYREMHPLGTVVDKSNEDYYSCVLRDSFEHVMGDKYTTVNKGYELCVNAGNGDKDYWLRVKGGGAVHIESEEANIEMYCKDGIAFINADRIEFNAKSEIVMNTKRYIQGQTAAETPSRHGGNMDPSIDPNMTFIKRGGAFSEEITGARNISCGSYSLGTMGTVMLSGQQTIIKSTHSSEEVIQGASAATGLNALGKSIVTQNGIINLRSAGVMGNGGIILQLNPTPSNALQPPLAAGYFSMLPNGPVDPTSSEIRMESGRGPLTFTNKIATLELGGERDGTNASIKMETTGPLAEIAIKNAKAEISMDPSGMITIKNEVNNLKQIIVDFMQDFIMHQHPVIGATNTGSLLPGAVAQAVGTGIAPQWVDNSGKPTNKAVNAINQLMSN